jgi:hypothetical protein
MVFSCKTVGIALIWIWGIGDRKPRSRRTSFVSAVQHPCWYSYSHRPSLVASRYPCCALFAFPLSRKFARQVQHFVVLWHTPARPRGSTTTVVLTTSSCSCSCFSSDSLVATAIPRHPSYISADHPMHYTSRTQKDCSTSARRYYWSWLSSRAREKEKKKVTINFFFDLSNTWIRIKALNQLRGRSLASQQELDYSRSNKDPN